MSSTSSSTVNESASQQPSLYASAIITFILALITVALRFWARRLKGVALWLDDWLCLAALVFAGGLLINYLFSIVRANLGKHANPTDELAALSVYSVYLFTEEFLYTFAIVFVKYAVIALYYHIFGHTSIRGYLAALTACVTLWGIAVIITSCLQCIPIQLVWDKSISGVCNVDQRKWFLGISVPNTVTDAALIALPLAYVKQLNTNANKKVAVAGLFLLGGVVCIASIMRIVSLVQEDETDLTWNFGAVAMWTLVETNLAIVSACLPCLRPIWTFMWTGSVESRSRTTSGFRSSAPWSRVITPGNMFGRSKQDDTDSMYGLASRDVNNEEALAPYRKEHEASRTVRKNSDTLDLKPLSTAPRA